jgi:threonine synthase
MPGVLLRYGEYLPLTPATPRLTLREGSTPLLPAPRLADWVGVDELFLKVEGLNPTGSFKDRGMVLAVARAIEDGAQALLCASTGNTAASAAAYAAHAGIEAVVLLPRGHVAAGKLAQAVMYGARVLTVAGNFDDALDLARDAAVRYDVALVNSVNPFRIEGQTTAAFEICDELTDAPELLALPVGNGGNISAYWLGFQRALDHGRAHRLPRLLGAQAEGAAPLVCGHPIAEPDTVATAIRIGNPASWQLPWMPPLTRAVTSAPSATAPSSRATAASRAWKASSASPPARQALLHSAPP